MKKAFLMVLACLLLAGCGAPSETVTPTDSWPDSALAETNEAAAESLSLIHISEPTRRS